MIKKVNLRTSDIRSVSNPTLRQIFKSQNIPDGLTVEVVVSTGRERSKHIPNDFVDEILTAVSSEGGGLDKAEVSKGRLIQAKVNKNNKKLKDQIVDVELIDLLEGKICVEYNFNLGGNRGNRLNEHVVQAQMSALYERNLNKILSNIK